MFKICAIIFRPCYSLTLSDPFGNLLRLSVEFKQFLVLNQFLSPVSCQILQCAVLPFYGTLKMEKTLLTSVNYKCQKQQKYLLVNSYLISCNN